MRWINAPGRVVRPFDGSAMNQNEAEAVVQEIRRIVGTGYDGTIGIVSPFRAQTNRIKDLVDRDRQLAESLQKRNLLVDTVHRFQGDERDLMIFSPVVSQDVHEGAVHFLTRTGNLFNVAITRARSALIVVGDRQACSTVPIPYLNHFVEYVADTELHSGGGPTADGFEAPKYEVGPPPIVSEWEPILRNALSAAGIETEPQYPVEQYRLDLALLSWDRKLDIEVDGERYHRAWDGDLVRRDMLRNRRLIELGWDVMRFWIYEIRDDMEACIARVRAWLEASP